MTFLERFTFRKTFARGVHPPEFKDATQDKPVRRLPFAPEMVIPLSQHTGAPAKPVVRERQEVVRGEPIAEPGGFVSVPMHAPATGVVSKIALIKDPKGAMTPAIYLELYPSASQEVLYGADADIDAMSPKELVAAVQATGVVGLGGAAFPTHVKLALPEGKTIDTVIANGCECEPYLTCDHRVMVEEPNDIITGLRIIRRALGASRVVIAVEKNKPDAIKAVRAALDAAVLPGGHPFEVVEVETKYPQGAEKMLVTAILGREVPSGGLPVDAGAAVFNVGTLAQIGRLLPKRQGLIERVVTVTGPGIEEPGNYLIALGTPLQFVLKHVGLKDTAAEIIFGGPMMGMSISSVDVPITKGVTGILVLTENETQRQKKLYPCIKCSTCVEACPMHLNPSELGLLARKRRYGEMEDTFHLLDCFECGCCSFVCPSGIPLVQYFRVAKVLNRERKAGCR